MVHERIRKFNTADTYPEQNLDNDLCHAVITRGGVHNRQLTMTATTERARATGPRAGDT